MQYVRGQDLHEVVDYEGPSMELTRKVMPELCDAVTELHESFEYPIIHRDIKPSNVKVFLTKGPTVAPSGPHCRQTISVFSLWVLFRTWRGS